MVALTDHGTLDKIEKCRDLGKTLIEVTLSKTQLIWVIYGIIKIKRCDTIARPKKYIISLSETDVNKLQAVINKKVAFKSIIRWCQILLELNENNPRYLTQMQIANSFGVCKATVSNIVKDYIEQGLDVFITYKRNPNSNAKRKADGRDEARITELACSQPPEGRIRWNLRLLEEKSRVVLDTPIGKDAIRDILKNRT